MKNDIILTLEFTDMDTVEYHIFHYFIRFGCLYYVYLSSEYRAVVNYVDLRDLSLFEVSYANSN